MNNYKQLQQSAEVTSIIEKNESETSISEDLINKSKLSSFKESTRSLLTKKFKL